MGDTTRERVRKLLLERYREDAPPITTKNILEILQDGNISKSTVNKLLYNDDLELDRIMDLCKAGGKPKNAPTWRVCRKCERYDTYPEIERLAWRVYEMLRDSESHSMEFKEFPKHIQEAIEKCGWDKLVDTLKMRIIIPQHELIVSRGTHTLLYDDITPTRVGYLLDCDDITHFKRAEPNSIRLGMAIQEFVSSRGREQELVLQTRSEGLYNVLKALVKTERVLHEYNVAVTLKELDVPAVPSDSPQSPGHVVPDTEILSSYADLLLNLDCAQE